MVPGSAGHSGVAESKTGSTRRSCRRSETPIRFEWNARFSAIAWRLHTVTAVDGFRERAKSSALTAAERRQALVAIAFVDDPQAAHVMAELTLSDLPDVAAQAAWWMTYRKANDWRVYPVEGWVPAAPDTKPALD